ncbi:unnamed protein product [Musa acuminata subsp. malaccensis]|uniref:(wild Malaysian banana) hypothetical protein n=1 Tax=Musa acuminata subsp. malaccensis TaxID=214687 RepID=A0A804I9Y7_MUSAM|nr:unnamed protein product [Musa acuminata subsp. malaccensis]
MDRVRRLASQKAVVIFSLSSYCMCPRECLNFPTSN